MVSSRVKKKKARAAVRNKERQRKNTFVEVDEAPAKKAAAREAVPEEQEGRPADKPAKFVEARFAQVGQKLVNWARNWVVEYAGRTRMMPGGVTADSIPDGQLEYMFKGWDSQGNETAEFGFKGFYPLRDDQADVARIMERYLYKKAIEERKMGKAIARHERAAAKAEGGEVDETGGGDATPRRPRAPRGELDPRTGCTPGSDGHAFGEIMLRVKPGAVHRKDSVDEIAALLGQRMDKAKSKALAQSWYSTLKRKKPEIYGKLGE